MSKRRRKPSPSLAAELAPQAEKDVIAAVLLCSADGATPEQRETAATILRSLRAEYFADETRSAIVSAMIALQSRNGIIGHGPLCHELRDKISNAAGELGEIVSNASNDAGNSWEHNLENLRATYAANTGSDAPLSARSKRKTDPTAQLIRLSDVKPEQISFLWPGRIALGKVCMFSGDPGLGKSFVSLDVAARVSRGRQWPDCEANAPLGSVIILSSEDGLADTIRPRLDALHADAAKIVAIQSIVRDGYERPFNLKDDAEQLEYAARDQEDCKLIIIDPITSYLGGVDGNKSADVRMVLDPLKGLAERTGAAVLLINHLNKGTGNAAYRSCGSISIQGMVRTAWAFAADQDDRDRRLMVATKNNVAKDSTGLAFRLIDGRVEWEPDPVTMNADEALFINPHGGGRKGEKQDAANDWLASRLSAGAVKSKTLDDEARSNGIAKRTLERAKQQLRVISKPQGGIPSSPWVCWLPENEVCQATENTNSANPPDNWQTSILDGKTRDEIEVCQLPGGMADFVPQADLAGIEFPPSVP